MTEQSRTKRNNERPSNFADHGRSSILNAVKTPLGFFALIVLILEALLGTVAASTVGIARTILIFGILAITALLVIIVIVLVIHRPTALYAPREFKEKTPRDVAIAGAVGESVLVVGNRNIAVDTKGQVVSTDVSLDQEEPKLILSESEAFDRLGTSFRRNIDQLEQNVSQARKESAQFFKLTLVFSSFGFLVVLLGIFLLYFGHVTAGIVSAVSSVVPQVTAALFFRKDKELREAIESYHKHIMDSQQILTMKGDALKILSWQHIRQVINANA